MRRAQLLLAGVLPFHPMSLGSYQVLAGLLSPTSAKKISVPVKEKAEVVPNLFISPKHDGVRLLSHVAPQSKGTKTSSVVNSTTKPSKPSSVADSTTCFSRFGRPIRGLFWIEKELEELRLLSGDPELCLDGELYIHSKSKQVLNRTRSVTPPSLPSAGSTEGFSQVSCLIQTLRGGRTPLPRSLGEVLRIVPSIPQYCLFDVVRYTPTNNVGPPEIKALREVAMSQCCMHSMTQMAVAPNHTPFVQRLRTLNFLCNLLALHQRSKQIGTVEVSASTGQVPPDWRSEKFFYKGGSYVGLVPYAVLPQITDASMVLNQYITAGYEGAVVRTALNRYHIQEKRSSKTLSGYRSLTAVKLLPYFEDEFVVLDILQRPNFVGLLCATKSGATFRLPLPAMVDHTTREEILRALRGSKGTSREVVGTFVTLQYSSLMVSGVPRFPKLKGIRGGKGWYL